MKCFLGPVLLILTCAIATAADATFTSTLEPDEISASGIDGLTPDQVARLNKLVERYKSTEVTREVEKAVQETRAAGPKVGSEDEPKRIETKIAGPFNGWQAGSLFRFANGQVWRPSNKESYRHHKVVQDPVVVLEKSSVIGYWMNIDGFPRLRVKRVE